MVNVTLKSKVSNPFLSASSAKDEKMSANRGTFIKTSWKKIKKYKCLKQKKEDSVELSVW